MFLKSALIVCVILGWMGITFLIWKQFVARIAFLSLPVLVIIPFVLPPTEINIQNLRSDYVRRMTMFEGTKYYWGGESSRGIDCSGLPRRALRDALLADGIKNFNGGAFRGLLEHWWFDASAKALSQGYRNYTKPLGITGTIHDMDHSSLVVGDLAVTTSGVHILAYAGDGNWIQADPKIGAVATLPGKTSDNRWFQIPVTLHRWQIFFE